MLTKRNLLASFICLAITAMVSAQTADALPAAYSGISTDAESTFGWAKGFAITVVIFTFVMSLVKLAKRR